MAISKKVTERLTTNFKKYLPVLTAAKHRDVGETDTVTIVKDMLADVFGYDKYTELTSEFAIRGTYCDLAIRLEGKLTTLIEVKAIGIELRDPHVKQAIDYAANQGIDWVLLTNGMRWCVYRVYFTKPIAHELVVDLDMSLLNPRSEQDLEMLYLWCKEGWQRSALGDFHAQKQALSPYFLSAILIEEPALELIRRELRRVTPDIRIDIGQIRTVLLSEVLKRELVEGEKAETARGIVKKVAKKPLRAKAEKVEVEEAHSNQVDNEVG